MNEQKEKLHTEIIYFLKMIFDPEIPVNIYDLGLIYKIDINDELFVNIDMTLTNPNCPVADDLVRDVTEAVSSIPAVTGVNVNLVFEPEWSSDMIPDHVKLELGLL